MIDCEQGVAGQSAAAATVKHRGKESELMSIELTYRQRFRLQTENVALIVWRCVAVFGSRMAQTDACGCCWQAAIAIGFAGEQPILGTAGDRRCTQNKQADDSIELHMRLISFSKHAGGCSPDDLIESNCCTISRKLDGSMLDNQR